MADKDDNVRVTRRDVLGSALGGAATVGLGGCLGAARTKTMPLTVTFGVIADAQYADYPPAGSRYYRKALDRLAACADAFNSRDLAFVVHLGDLIDRDFASFEKVLAACGRMKAPTHQVLGNHDFTVNEDEKAKVRARLGVGKGYYHFAHSGWRFVVLDGNDISLQDSAPDSEKRRAAEEMRQRIKESGRRNASPYSGALGAAQLAWLRRTLAQADQAGEKVIAFSHYPAYPKHGANLWNDEELVGILDAHPCVAAHLNGHHHRGMYGVNNGIHYLTLRAMVETPEKTAYAVVEARADQLNIIGTGRAVSRVLPLGRPTGAV